MGKMAKPVTKEMVKFLDSFSEEILLMYPDELVISVKEGDVSINMPEPLIVEVPGKYRQMPVEEGEKIPTNLIVFDSAGEIADLEIYDTVLLVKLLIF